MARVVVGMSGGVDSAVAAFLLKAAGFDVIGVTLRTWPAGEENRCCEIDDARRVAAKLKIPFYPLNCVADFQKNVTEPFAEAYIRGVTPIPCIDCNRFVKWARLLYTARLLRAEHIATGHYAGIVQLDNGRYAVRVAADTKKDQSYMLYKLTQEQLRYTLLPLGELTKKEVRVIAEREGLPVAQKRDSQELCFAAAGDHADYIERHCRESLPEKGNFVDESGRVLGVHKGIYRYTVGQRRGLGLTLGHPAYVKRICAESREIVIGDEHSLYSGGVVCIDVIFMSMPEPEPGTLLRCMVKIRYSHAPQAAVLEMTADGAARITFDSPVRAAAPGQAAVFYDGAGCVIGGGVILESFARP